ncbi:MAG TPA: hypothetical protein VGO75_05085, partial [Gemmatimonadaceae bacterium]|nr:hypothetical protein [Gemmatimonadaceae bacterium]
MKAALLLAVLGAAACAPPPPPPPPPKPVVVGPPTDTMRIALTDLGQRTYYGHQGGIYPNGLNQPPPDHDSAVRAQRNRIRPLDVNGDESPFGKYVLLSIGNGTTSQEWCSASSAPPCGSWTFMGRAALDAAVNRASLVIVNGAESSDSSAGWASAASANYDRIKIGRLNPLGLSENQVEVVWLNLESSHPRFSLPSDSADAWSFLVQLGQVARALRIRYPQLQIVFVSSRIYGGYDSTGYNPEPFAYEEGFSVKWLIESQITEMRASPANPLAGSLNYAKKSAPVLMWGPYLWANGMLPRADSTFWGRFDFEPDGVHPSQAGETKAAGMLLEFFKNMPYTKC